MRGPDLAPLLSCVPCIATTTSRGTTAPRPIAANTPAIATWPESDQTASDHYCLLVAVEKLGTTVLLLYCMEYCMEYAYNQVGPDAGHKSSKTGRSYVQRVRWTVSRTDRDEQTCFVGGTRSLLAGRTTCTTAVRKNKRPMVRPITTSQRNTQRVSFPLL